jgi:acyl carrier protein
MVSERLKLAICKELEIEEIEITDETTSRQIPGWDSLRHISIVLSIESEFGIRLRAMEVLKCQNIGELQKLIDHKVQMGCAPPIRKNMFE